MYRKRVIFHTKTRWQVGKYSDISITCSQCGKKFIFSEDEQEFYKSKGYTPPLHCKQCRSARQQRNSECTRCGNKLVESAPQYCAACLINVQLDFEQKALGLKSQLQEAEARWQAVSAEKAKMQTEASLGLQFLEAEKNKLLEETRLNMVAVESEKAALVELLRQKESTIADLEQRLDRMNREIRGAPKESDLQCSGALLHCLKEKIESLERNQNNLKELLIKFIEMNHHNHRNPHILESFKSFFRSDRRSPA
jgi:hypothetical protein